ncbi:MAG: hypothetical protein L7U72_02785 [Rubripirellula sp.]|nr:hypothetical protein [Rubripirellula sp.]
MLRQRRRLKRSCQRDSQVAGSAEQSSTSEPVHPSSLTQQDTARRLQRSPERSAARRPLSCGQLE